jgi:hypothetical protein
MNTVLRWPGCSGHFDVARAKAPPPSRSRTLVEFIPLEIGEDALAYGHPSDLVVRRYWRPRQYLNGQSWLHVWVCVPIFCDEAFVIGLLYT